MLRFLNKEGRRNLPSSLFSSLFSWVLKECDLLCVLSLHSLLHRLPPVKVIRAHRAIWLPGLLPLSQASSWTTFPQPWQQLTRGSLLSLQLMSVVRCVLGAPDTSACLAHSAHVTAVCSNLDFPFISCSHPPPGPCLQLFSVAVGTTSHPPFFMVKESVWIKENFFF